MMDEFGVLVESIGFKAHGKSAPMAKLKPKPKYHFNRVSSMNASSLNNSSSLPVDELDGIFTSNININKTSWRSQNVFGDDDVFGMPVSSGNQYRGVDLESVFSSSNNNGKNVSDLNPRNSVGSNAFDDLLGSKSEQNDPVVDLIGSFGVSSRREKEKKGPAFDDLIPGFGGSSPSKHKVYSETNLSPESNGRPCYSSSTRMDDPFLVFESSASKSDSMWPFAGPPEQDIGKGSVQSSLELDDLDDFAMGGSRSGSQVDGIRTRETKPNSGTASTGFQSGADLDAFFGSGSGMQQNKAARPCPMAQDDIFGNIFHEEKGPKVKQTSSRSSFSSENTSPATNMDDNFTSLFGDFTTSAGEFHEIEGEPEERRRARLNRHMRMNARMAEALTEKNQRDLQSQHEQEEKHRLAETLDYDMKRWAAGKEGNLRALLSSLQQVLWPECGWRPVSLSDMITAESVKRVYKKVTLCVHPDKVQQKGANLHQKYVAEKVFDILKEAWNRFSAEELR